MSQIFDYCGGDSFVQKKQVSLDVLPDECLYEIFRRLPADQERSSCACVSKRWLMLLSSIPCEDLCKENKVAADEAEEIESDGFLTRSLEGKKATDVRLAAVAVGSGGRGGLGKLVIRGSNSVRGVTDLGLKAVARCCPSLKTLSLWNVSSIGDEGVVEIASGCHRLEKLDLCNCPSITNKSLLAIAKNCPTLTSISIEGCQYIGNEGLQAIGQLCPNLKSVTIKDCPLIGDQGVASLMSSASFILNKLKLQGLNVTDLSLAVIGHYGKAITDLVLSNLQNVNEKGSGSWEMLKVFSISGHSPFHHAEESQMLQLMPWEKLCPQLQCVNFNSLPCITEAGLLSLIESCDTGAGLVKVGLNGCVNVTDNVVISLAKFHGGTLEMLNLEGCAKVTDAALVAVADDCLLLNELHLSKCAITDFGVASLARSRQLSLQILSLSGCSMLSDKCLPFLVRLGQSLMGLNLQNCNSISSSVIDMLVERLYKCDILS
ncbi:EIN3-binding F-box protein 1 [Bienertia sinuspersici]